MSSDVSKATEKAKRWGCCLSIPGSLDLAGIADFRRCVAGGRWGSADLAACRAGPAAPAALHRGFEQVQVIPSRAAWGSPLQRPEHPMLAPHSSGAALRAGGCPGKEREKGTWKILVLVPVSG